jgi:ADP-dependent NAD(P)H-hydrate dehydratase / NAD(P)H-hydrate epimerase
MSLPSTAFSQQQIRSMEAAAIASGVDGYALMLRAGAAALRTLTVLWPSAKRLAVVCGPGNNGGDGLVLARLAALQGLTVRVLQTGITAGAETSSQTPVRSEAQQALVDFRAAGQELFEYTPQLLADADVVVDALLGSGVRAPLREQWQRVIADINACGRPVLALDIPSGLDPDRGVALPAVRASATIAFIGIKQGLWLSDGPAYCGKLYFDSLGVQSDQFGIVKTDAHLLAQTLPPRLRNSHKSQYGRVLVVGGGTGMAGAVRLAGEAALRVGAGLVTIASLGEHQGIIVGTRPELMFRAVVDAISIAAAMQDMDVIAVGPGLGRDAWAKMVLNAVFAALQPTQQLILDADALNLVAAGVGQQSSPDWILTPHPGEAARLLGIDTAAIQNDRVSALLKLQATRGGIVVLKGAGTLISDGINSRRICMAGNPGMAVPGMGDVLTGCIAGILGQSMLAAEPVATATAVAAAVHLHAMAGDRCAANGMRGILASEVVQALRSELAGLP